ncbi:T9SS type A sorting domain-containing protein [Flavobacteriales bacterium]|nr:T9SS type A sorting domain-containing protein [Flavobacteriales bacterium]
MIKFTTLLAITSFVSFSAFSQISNNNSPVSLEEKLSEKVPVTELVKPNLSEIKIQTDEDAKNGESYKFAIMVDSDIDTDNSGVWEDLDDGSRVWRLSIKIEGAKALGLYYDAFRLPSTGELFVYNQDMTQIIGGFTNSNNHSSGLFANELISGDFLTLEYHQKGEGNPIIHINQVAYCYRGVSDLFEVRDFDDSDPCQVNANCSESDDWQDIKRSATRISVRTDNTLGWCSGAFINNTAQDCKPYILSADHCGFSSSAANLNQWVFYFAYESSDCDNPISSPASPTITGASLVANSNQGTINQTSDFLLLELNQEIPFTYGAFASGWDRTNTASQSGVCFHHPSGDIKKISTYNSTLTTSAWTGNGTTHWRVRWAETENGHGVTEGGSSGSPIYNSNGHIIGDLSGGSSFCTNANSPDLYGKLSYSWSPNGSSNNERLQPWLDPTNSQVTTLDGIACGTTLFSNFYGVYTNIGIGGLNQYFYTGTGEPASYMWTFYGGDPITSTEANPIVTYENSGTFTVRLKVTDSEGNESTEIKTQYILVDENGGSVSITENKNIEFEVFPNPSNGVLFLSQDVNSKSEVTVFDIFGKKITDFEFKTETERFDLSHLSNGVYFLTIKNENGFKTEKISISK